MHPVRAAICSGTVLFAAAAHAAPPELPIPKLALTVTAPSPRGPWTVRMVNEDDRPLRVPADIRLLRFSITLPDEAAPPGRKPKPITCSLPHPLRPRAFPKQRALYLAPGQSYEERFDPRLFCFGARESQALVPGAVVSAFLGGQSAPYVVEDLAWPPATAPLREIAAQPVTIGPGSLDEASPSHDGGPSPVTSSRGEAMPSDLAADDERAPRLALEAPRFVDASSPHVLVARFVARNIGRRPMRVVLRANMLSFSVEGPGGDFRCEPPERERNATPPEVFRTLAPGAVLPIPVLLDEACTNAGFRRPGLYRVTATLHADATSEAYGLHPFTAVVTADRPALVRLLSGPEPFYATRPEAKPAPSARDTLAPEADGGPLGLSLPALLLRREHLPPLR